MSKVTSLSGDSAAKAAEIKRLNTELSELGKKFDDAQALADMAEANRKGLEQLNKPAGGLPTPQKPATDHKPITPGMTQNPNQPKHWLTHVLAALAAIVDLFKRK